MKQEPDTVVTFVKLTKVQRGKLTETMAKISKLAAGGISGRASIATLSNVLRYALDLGIAQMEREPSTVTYKNIVASGMRRGRRYVGAA